ncbi:hypothetical protein HYPSUDRAFT_44918 [Hypholoma sublateritium FD-334 SS-4]|uniref:SWR1-complex protein 5 n=1 Tax=Hypholoma sublateritium (strain FD-334 SS-4) TaxID=945553 RepID=A0A0D2PEZ5_HYPSF|nr:hypothetical protein HYPSUDRAFT_44918 [Hypholoma sublateritium FD-334 SS-4]
MSPRKEDVSDSEDDEDYTPLEGKESEDSASEAENHDDFSTATEKPVDEAERKRERDALWSTFQESVRQPEARTEQQTQPPKMVKIERKYLFAGKEVLEVVDVPEDSQDAKKWPLWIDHEKHGPTDLPFSSPEDATDTAVFEKTHEGRSMQKLCVDTTRSTSDPVPPPVPKLQMRRAGPRKSKITLAPLPGSTKAKKMTTLDKSAMDWKSHLQTETVAGSSVADELTANRKSGGYLEKVEFLKRVGERKDETLESLKSSKRRRL